MSKKFICDYCGKEFGFHDGVAMQWQGENFDLCWPCVRIIKNKALSGSFTVQDEKLADRLRKEVFQSRKA